MNEKKKEKKKEPLSGPNVNILRAEKDIFWVNKAPDCGQLLPLWLGRNSFLCSRPKGGRSVRLLLLLLYVQSEEEGIDGSESVASA